MGRSKNTDYYPGGGTIRFGRIPRMDGHGFLADTELRDKMDKYAEKWGCPNTADPYFRYTGHGYDAYLIIHYSRKHCSGMKAGSDNSTDQILCMRIPLNGNRKNVYIRQHKYQRCNWKLTEEEIKHGSS